MGMQQTEFDSDMHIIKTMVVSEPDAICKCIIFPGHLQAFETDCAS